MTVSAAFVRGSLAVEMLGLIPEVFPDSEESKEEGQRVDWMESIGDLAFLEVKIYVETGWQAS